MNIVFAIGCVVVIILVSAFIAERMRQDRERCEQLEREQQQRQQQHDKREQDRLNKLVLAERIINFAPVPTSKPLRSRYSVNLRWITFADGDHFTTTAALAEARASGYFKHCQAYSPDDFDDEFKRLHGEFISKNPRGYGYWIWKPYFLLRTLNGMNENDILTYTDSGTVICGAAAERMAQYYDMLSDDIDVIVFRIVEPEVKWIKRDTFDAVMATNKSAAKLISADQRQRLGGQIIIRKTAASTAFVALWYALCSKYHLVDDSPSVVPNAPSFQEHRHDQAIMSTLSKLHPGCLALDDNAEHDEIPLTPEGLVRPFNPIRRR